jgi:hypothetical protein
MPLTVRLAAAVCCLLATLAAALAQPGRRVALVVGNSAYKLGPLANPVNDAEAVADALERQLKFSKVLLRKNLDRVAFSAALKELAREAHGAEVGLVFFAGHGIESKGRNYLVPTDAMLAGAADIELEAIALDSVLSQLESVTKLRLVILDACRNSPFPAGARSWRGLKAVAPELGTLVAYAAREGTLAADGKGRHSPFTAALLKRMVEPGVDVRRVFGYVRTDVSAATGGMQEPGIYSELGGDEVGSDPASPAGPVVAALDPALSVKPGSGASFRDLTADGRPCPECPEMVVVPAGSFMMGSPVGEAGDWEKDRESPRHIVRLARPFAVGRFEVNARRVCDVRARDRLGRQRHVLQP